MYKTVLENHLFDRHFEINSNAEIKIEDWRFLGSVGMKIPLAAVDASLLTLGTNNGQPVEAMRAAVVVKQPDVCTQVIRLGPYLRVDDSSNEKMIQLENFAKRLALRQISGGIVLLDGCTLPHSQNSEEYILGANLCNNLIISIKKRLMMSSVLPDINDVKDKLVAKVKNESSSYLLKIGNEPITLKADIYPHVNITDFACALSNLIKSDEIYMSYPNTLRLAHMYSKILPTETLAIQRIALRKKGLVISPNISDRKVILGTMWS